MIANIKILEKYCKDYKNIENYEDAVRSPLIYDLHHRLEISENKSKKDLIAENLYYNRPATELIFLEHGEHIRLHKANLSEETRQRMSDAKKGHLVSEETRQKISDANKGNHNTLGHHWTVSDETRQKLSESHKGKPAHNKGKHCHLENGKRVYTDYSI